MKHLNKIILLYLVIVINIVSSPAGENKILFKVNNEIITSIDIATEINYLKIINNDYQKLDKIRAIEIAKNSLIREKIKLIELSKIMKEIKLNDELMNNSLLTYFRQLEIYSIGEFERFFFNQGIDPDLVKYKITIEILWNQMIYNRFRKNIKIDENKIKDELLNSNKQKEYLLSEILFNLNENEILSEKLKIN